MWNYIGNVGKIYCMWNLIFFVVINLMSLFVAPMIEKVAKITRNPIQQLTLSPKQFKDRICYIFNKNVIISDFCILSYVQTSKVWNFGMFTAVDEFLEQQVPIISIAQLPKKQPEIIIQVFHDINYIFNYIKCAVCKRSWKARDRR